MGRRPRFPLDGAAPLMQTIEPKPVRLLDASSRVLVLGASGQVGRAWQGLLSAHGVEHSGLDLPAFDLGREEDVLHAVEPGFTHVINCAAWTDVDGAESDEPGATRVNADGVRVLARVCASAGAHLLHYSTDYVFAGDAVEPYTTDAPVSPLNAYGRSKAAGEAALGESGGRVTLVRSSWIYSPWGKNFVRTIAELGRTRASLRVVDDQQGRPTSAEQLARVSLALLRRGCVGTWHVCDGGSCTWFDLAGEVLRLTGSACRVEPCTSEEFPRPAHRPAFGVLDLSKTEALLGPLTDWRSAVADVVRRLGSDAPGAAPATRASSAETSA